VHIDDESLVTTSWWTTSTGPHAWSPEFIEARRQSVSLPHDYTQDLAQIQAPVLLIHGRYDRKVPFEVSIAILNHNRRLAPRASQQLRPRPAFEKPAEWTAQVLTFLKGY
jgi:2-hydroxy-6-oxonona-2,4-dienedioate hydrolase